MPSFLFFTVLGGFKKKRDKKVSWRRKDKKTGRKRERERERERESNVNKASLSVGRNL